MMKTGIVNPDWWAPRPSSVPEPDRELMIRRRRQMLIHCFLYYDMNTNMVDDHTWQKWADELTQLQQKHGHLVGFYDQTFEDWDGSTGFHLPADPNVVRVAQRLFNDAIKKKKQGSLF